MRIQITSKLKTFSNILSSVSESIPNSLIFFLDSFSLLLFATGILGVISAFPDVVCIVIQTVFMAITSFLIFYFLTFRVYPMVALKLVMLSILYLMDWLFY